MNMKNESMGSITENVASELNDNHSSVKFVVTVALALWFGIVFLLGAQGAFVQPPNSPPLPIFFGLAIPLAVFFTAYFSWSAFRAFILGTDLRLAAAIQAWRWAGSGFLLLYAQGVLPGLFAFPAGLGDMAIGVTAPWIVLGLVRHPSFAASRRYVVWNIMGILDLVVAGRLRPQLVTSATVGWEDAPEALLEPAIKLVISRKTSNENCATAPRFSWWVVLRTGCPALNACE